MNFIKTPQFDLKIIFHEVYTLECILGGKLMKATALDLRKKLKTFMLCERHEEIQLYYRGQLRGTIVPTHAKTNKRARKSVRDFAFFGINKDEKESVEATMKRLRRNRYQDLFDQMYEEKKHLKEKPGKKHAA